MRVQVFAGACFALFTITTAAPPKQPIDKNLQILPTKIYFPGSVSDYVVNEAAWTIEKCDWNYLTKYDNFPGGNDVDDKVLHAQTNNFCLRAMGIVIEATDSTATFGVMHDNTFLGGYCGKELSDSKKC